MIQFKILSLILHNLIKQLREKYKPLVYSPFYSKCFFPMFTHSLLFSQSESSIIFLLFFQYYVFTTQPPPPRRPTHVHHRGNVPSSCWSPLNLPMLAVLRTNSSPLFSLQELLRTSALFEIRTTSRNLIDVNMCAGC